MTDRRPLDLRLIALFFLSGLAGLIYEVVWLRMLIRAFGVTVHAVSTILVLYMAGLALGAIAGGRRLRNIQNPLRAYAIVEVLIGGTALASTFAMRALPSLMESLVGGHELGLTTALARFAVAFPVLFIPTFLMGSTLPLITGALVRRGANAPRIVGLLYGVNTVGAVAGVLAAGFVTLMLFGELRSVLCAVGANVLVGVLAYSLSRATVVASQPEAAGDGATSPNTSGASLRTLLIIYGISGFCALSYQVIWSRLASLLLGNSVYGFSMMLAAYLGGIGIGSVLMAERTTRLKRPLLVLAMLEIASAVLALLSLVIFTEIGVRETNEMYTYSQIWGLRDFVRMGFHSVLLVFPVTLILGAIFPVVNALASKAPGATEAAVGEIYGANTIGAVVGSMLTGFLMLNALGTLRSFIAVAIITFLIGAYLLRASSVHEGLPSLRTWVLGSAAAFSLVLAFSFRDPFFTVLRARIPERNTVLAHEEDANGTITMFEVPEQSGVTHRELFINGIHVSDTNPTIGEIMIGVPLSFQPTKPSKTMLVGLGAGEAFRTSLDFGMNTTAVDLQPIVLDLFKRFTPDEAKYTQNPAAKIVLNDGRNHLLSTKDKFDLVLVDGTPPVFASGMVNLYSREFAELVKSHLTPNGVFALWFPTVCFESDLWMVARNFVDVFGNTAGWSLPKMAGVLLLGSNSSEPVFETDETKLDERLAALGHRNIVVSGALIRRGLILPPAKLKQQTAPYPGVTDDRPYTEFPLLEFARNKRYFVNNNFALEVAAKP